MHGHKDILRVAPTYVVAILTAADDHSHHYLGVRQQGRESET